MPKRRSSKRHKRGWKSFQRRKPSRELRARILIVCEGEKTEPIYFRALRKDKQLSAAEVEAGPSPYGTDPRSVVDCAVDRKKEAFDDNEPYDKVWCVFDRDQHERFKEALNRAEAHDIGVAFSNPSFELWFLQHFRYSTAYIHRDNAVSELEQHIPHYDKSTDVYDYILPQQGCAVDNARRLAQYHVGVNEPTANPSTTVHELVTALNKLAQS